MSDRINLSMKYFKKGFMVFKFYKLYYCWNFILKWKFYFKVILKNYFKCFIII